MLSERRLSGVGCLTDLPTDPSMRAHGRTDLQPRPTNHVAMAAMAWAASKGLSGRYLCIYESYLLQSLNAHKPLIRYVQLAPISR